MLGLFVILDLTTFWLSAYHSRDQLTADNLTLVVVLAIVGIYYLAATLIFPDNPEEWPDFDAWYDKQNRLVLGGMLAANVGNAIGQIFLEAMRPTELDVGSDASIMADGIVGFSILFLLIALIVVRSRRVNLVLLSILVTLLFAGAVADGIL